MKLTRLALLPLVALTFSLGACDADKPECDKLAKHITEVLAKEKGADIPQEAKDKAIKDMNASCQQETPKQEILDCAMAAQTRAALIACDPEVEAKAE